jgi:hypothetical protein
MDRYQARYAWLDAMAAGTDGGREQIVGRAAFIAHCNATFDFEAGLADVYRRARRAGQVWPQHPAWGELLPRELVPASPN